MRLGVISDTHGFLRPEVFAVFEEVDHILHAGDIGAWDVMLALEALAPVTAVWGNGDPPDIQARVPPVAALQLDGFDIVVTHGHDLPDGQGGSPTPARLVAAFPRAEIIVYGHTHRPLLELVNRTVTVMNPGGAGQARFNLKPSVGIMELEPGIPPRARVVPLLPE
ncbi:MAG TPA: metallophosphoesterase family protein [Gemmatimonadales bacterium]|nr:metallophosphoesterase family protein [Gemmatimonadales bacterium]